MTVLRVLSWELALLVSFAGWGSLCARYFIRDNRPDAGLRLGWGVAIVLPLGGCLVALHLAKMPALVAIVLAGGVAALHEVWLGRSALPGAIRRFARDVAEHPGAAVLAAVIVGIVLVRLAASPFERSDTFDTDDDAVAYLFYPKEMIQSGASVQPFSDRHPLSLNGQSFLQALLLPAARIEWAYGLDAGVFVAIVVALLVGASSRPWLRRAPVAMLPELVFVTIPDVRTNLASTMTGVAALLTVYRSMQWFGSAYAGRRRAVVLGLCIAAATTFRTFYVPALAVILAVTYGIGLLGCCRETRRDRLAEGVVVCATAFVAILPWMIVNYRSDATPLYPLMRGTVRALHPRIHDPLYDLQVIERTLVGDAGFGATILIVLASLGLPEGSWRRPRTGVVFGAFAAVAALAVFRQGMIREDVERYCVPMILAAVLVSGLEALQPLSSASTGAPTVRQLASMALATFAFAIHMHDTRGAIGSQYEEAIDAMLGADRSADELDERDARYRAMQAAMAPGAGVLSVTDEGYLFDFGRNHVMTLDHPGLASPAPGFPVGGGDDEYARFLKRNGVRYVAFAPGEADPYSIDIWEQRAAEANDYGDPSRWMQSDWAPVLVSVLREMTALTTKYAPVYSEGGYLVVDLNTPRT
jgi:hypothetical protein